MPELMKCLLKWGGVYNVEEIKKSEYINGRMIAADR